MIQFLISLALIVGLMAFLAYLASHVIGRVIIWENQVGLMFHKGRFHGIAEPGIHWMNKLYTKIMVMDIRPSDTVIRGQEILSSDGVSLKLSVHVRYKIVDALICYNSSQAQYSELYDYLPGPAYNGDLYSLVQIAARKEVGSVPIEELLNSRSHLSDKIKSQCAGQALERGIEIIDLEILDIMFPGDLKKVFAQVVNARQEGLAALERARGETAALRNLANAAKTLESNPALFQLRTLQVLGESSGNTVIIGSPELAGGFSVRKNRQE